MTRPPAFDDISDDEFRDTFMHIITHGSKDNTYKFALARFLLDYGRKHEETHVDFEVIAGYFLQYYWIQICKLKMKHAPQAAKKPEIVKIIEKEFTEKYYPQTYREICQKEPEKIARCTERITRLCFHNVIWRFQKIKADRAKIKGSKAAESCIFFEYKIKRTINDNKKYVDLDYGINLNPDAVRFLRQNNAVLLKSVILEWARFLEQRNVGLPKIIEKTEGKNMERRSLAKYRQILDPFFTRCFYCNEQLEDGSRTHVEHVIPFDYIAEDDIWNLTLACNECNCRKLGALPPRKYIDKLIDRNEKYKTQIPILERSLVRLDRDFDKIVNEHYRNAKSHGYAIMRDMHCVQDDGTD